MSKTVEIGRFSSGGKTFFFNKGEAANGSPYLAINTLYGKGTRERVVLFPGHFFPFYKALIDAVRDITGFAAPAGDIPEPARLDLPTACPDCEAGSTAWEIIALPDQPVKIVCKDCREVIYRG